MNDEIIDFYLQVADELCDDKEWCIGGVGEPLRRFAALVVAAEREALPEEVCEAYGWLFHETSSERANRARRLLLTCMTKEQQKVGIQMAKERGAVVRRMSTTRGE
jgi:hypothetical protein